MAKLVSKTYGDALFQVVVSTKKEELFLEEAREVLGILAREQEFTGLMNHPKISKEEKFAILEAVFQGKIQGELLGLMQVMVEKGRFRELSQTLVYFMHCIREEKGIGVAHITSALPLSDLQKEEIKNRLIDTTTYDSFEMICQVDSSLIGGIRIQVKDRVVDGSVSSKIHDLKRELMKIQLKVGEQAP